MMDPPSDTGAAQQENDNTQQPMGGNTTNPASNTDAAELVDGRRLCCVHEASFASSILPGTAGCLEDISRGQKASAWTACGCADETL